MYLSSYLLDLYHKCNKEILMILIMLTTIFPMVVFLRKLISAIIKDYIGIYPHYDKIIKKYSVHTYLLHTLLSVYLIFWDNNLYPVPINNPHFITGIKNAILILYTGIATTILLIKSIDVISDIYRDSFGVSAKVKPLSLYVQILKISIACIAIVTITSNLLNISLGTFLTSLGAAAALLTFLFKDTLLGMFASLQLISQDIVRIGDRISVGALHIDGIVENITITVVKIRNSDQSISTISTSSLLNTNVINWRGIKESVARKIQRAIHIDINSVMFIPNSFLDELKKSSYLSKDVMNNVILERDYYNNLTNIKLFRLYIVEYLKSNPAVYQKDFTFLVRQLASTPAGLPIELSVFTDRITDSTYEEVQAEIFDHLFAILPEFKLKIFQRG